MRINLKKAIPFLEKVTSTFFMLGLATSKLKNFPNIFLSSYIRVTSLASYLIAYTTWGITSLSNPGVLQKRTNWYPFVNFKIQHQIAALLGTIATILCITNPTLVIPTGWLFTFSNLYWTLGEHLKKNNPLTGDLNPKKQIIYCYFAISITLTSFIGAFSATSIFFFPPTSVILLPLSVGISAALTLLSLGLFIKFKFGTFPLDKPPIAMINKSSSEEDSPGQTPDRSPSIFKHPLGFHSDNRSVPTPESATTPLHLYL